MYTRKIALLSLLGLAVVAVAAVWANSPHFGRASAAFQGPGPNLVVTFKEDGLGSTQTIHYTASANCSAVYACINGGNKNPSASNKRTVSGPVATPGTFSSGKNGSISQSLTITPPQPNFTCPPGQTMVLVSVTYTGVRITDDTNQVFEDIPGTFFRSFYNL